MTRNIVFALAFVILQCALSAGVEAQVGPSCTEVAGNGMTLYGGCPQWAVLGSCQTEGPFLQVWEVMTSVCPAPAGPAETRCADCEKALPQASKPISLATGNTFIQQTDVKLPGLSGGLNLVRTWNSMWPSTQTATQVGLFGPNWRSNFEERVFVGTDNYVKYARGDGSFWSFGAGGPGWLVAAPANNASTLVYGATNWIVTLPNGEQRLFNIVTGNLVEIIDRNGNTTQLSYDGIGRLTTVTDPVSRTLNFTYGSNSSYLVTGVSSSVGSLSLSYAYDSQGRLIQVTKPDLTTISFQYNSNSLISAVLDSNGVVLESHTYDSNGRGLTSSRANGVDAVTISYATQ
jgi:YD repeat-containing protein